jgi:hypothetical protein
VAGLPPVLGRLSTCDVCDRYPGASLEAVRAGEVGVLGRWGEGTDAEGALAGVANQAGRAAGDLADVAP